MSVITLTSDWGYKDYYAAAVKGKILSYLPNAIIVDISHELPHFNSILAAFLIKSCYDNFPKGTVHIIGVNTEASVETPHLAVSYDGHFFIGADNGVFTLLFDNQPEKIIEIEVAQDSDYFTFPSRDLFAKVACLLASGNKIEELGEEVDFRNKNILIKPVVDGNTLRGTVIYIDSYENLITNISEKLFKENVKRKKFNIILPNKYSIDSISKSYWDVKVSDLVAFFNASGLLEIAMNNGKASSLLGINLNSIVRIEFE